MEHEINAPEALRRGDKIEMQMTKYDDDLRGYTALVTYTVRTVTFGLMYEGDAHRRILVTFEEHLGSLAIPNVPLDEWSKDSAAGFARAYRVTS